MREAGRQCGCWGPVCQVQLGSACCMQGQPCNQAFSTNSNRLDAAIVPSPLQPHPNVYLPTLTPAGAGLGRHLRRPGIAAGRPQNTGSGRPAPINSCASEHSQAPVSVFTRHITPGGPNRTIPSGLWGSVPLLGADGRGCLTATLSRAEVEAALWQGSITLNIPGFRQPPSVAPSSQSACPSHHRTAGQGQARRIGQRGWHLPVGQPCCSSAVGAAGATGARLAGGGQRSVREQDCHDTPFVDNGSHGLVVTAGSLAPTPNKTRPHPAHSKQLT